jgi:hypothetical protein
VRIDVGRLAAFLARHPLEEFVLNVEGIVDPLQKGETFRSSLPSVRPTPVVITRASLLGQFDRSKMDEWPGAYQRALGSITEGIGRGTLRRRMLAARQLASLLALVREVEESKASMPKPLADIVKKPVLLSMLQAVLADEAGVVRAEMLAALGHVRLDESIIPLLAGAIEDRSSLVRFRLVELLGASGTAGQETIVDYLAQDGDKMVRLMALAFRNGPKSR